MGILGYVGTTVTLSNGSNSLTAAAPVLALGLSKYLSSGLNSVTPSLRLGSSGAPLLSSAARCARHSSGVRLRLGSGSVANGSSNIISFPYRVESQGHR